MVLLRPAPARVRRAVSILALAAGCGFAAPALARANAAGDLADLSLEQLGNIEVVSVLRRAERLSDTPASVYVITAEDIHRSGATSLMEALRLAPNLQVARADAVQYAITARGFNSVLANKLLVMVDGRTVYSPLFSGVFWEAHDIRLSDVDRIEVVSGPGGTPWGTNAVNGVINVITRSALASNGVTLNAGGGNRERVGGGSWTAPLPHGGAVRLYGRATAREHDERELDDAAIRDAATGTRGGFRADWAGGVRSLMLESELSRVDVEQGTSGMRRVTGAHALGRWALDRPDGRSTRVQAYWDRAGRDQPGAVRDVLHTADLEAQQGLRPFAGHDLLFGAGFRYQADRVENLMPTIAILPDRRDLRYANAFLEDVMALGHAVEATAGVKFEHNDYTGWETLPSARLAWKPRADHLVWAAFSRAVRAPARVDRDFYSPAAPPHVFVNGGPGFESELAHVTELGLRGQASPRVSYSVTGFYADYDRLRSLAPSPDGPEFANGLRADVSGFEAWARWRVTEWWRLDAGLAQQRQHRRVEPGNVDVVGTATLGNDPAQWWSARSSFDLPRDFEFDANVREVGALPSPHVPGYVAVDARLGWRARNRLELSVTGRNLFDGGHPEWGAGPAVRAEFPRAVFARVELRP